jgi:hypothetical protein
MRSKLSCWLASAVFLCAGSAHAETTRLRIPIDDLPLQDEPIKLSAKDAVLPNGVKDHGAVPKSWRRVGSTDFDQVEHARCTDDRTGSVTTIRGESGSTAKIWEAGGKIWLDLAHIDTTWNYVEVKDPVRYPLARIADGIWGYRRANAVHLVTATDTGFIEEGGFYACDIRETAIAAPAGTASVESSPKAVNEAIKQIAKNEAFSEPKKPPKWTPEWFGVEFKIVASVSKSSADASTTLNLVVKRP